MRYLLPQQCCSASYSYTRVRKTPEDLQRMKYLGHITATTATRHSRVCPVAEIGFHPLREMQRAVGGDRRGNTSISVLQAVLPSSTPGSGAAHANALLLQRSSSAWSSGTLCTLRALGFLPRACTPCSGTQRMGRAMSRL